MTPSNDETSDEHRVKLVTIEDHLNKLSLEQVAQARENPEDVIAALQARFAIDRDEAKRQLEGWLATTSMNAG